MSQTQGSHVDRWAGGSRQQQHTPRSFISCSCQLMCGHKRRRPTQVRPRGASCWGQGSPSCSLRSVRTLKVSCDLCCRARSSDQTQDEFQTFYLSGFGRHALFPITHFGSVPASATGSGRFCVMHRLRFSTEIAGTTKCEHEARSANFRSGSGPAMLDA